MPSGTLSNDEAAAYLGVAPKTLPRWRVEGRGPRFVKLGRRVAYRRETLDEWLAEQERRSTSDPRPNGGVS